VRAVLKLYVRPNTRGALYLISTDLALTRTNHRKQVDHEQED